MNGIRIIIAKEFSEIVRNRALVISSLIPVVMLSVIPFLVLGRGTRSGGRTPPSQISEMFLRYSPELSGLSQGALNQVFLMRQFVVFLLIVPVITALSIAIHSVIGEKQSRSLEPLLATPVSSLQLFVAKSLSAAIPSIALTWLLFALYGIGIYLLALPGVFLNVITSTTAAVILLIAPLVAILGLSLGVTVSSRVNDARSAQQIGALLILPIVFLFTAQLNGLYFLRLPVILVAAAVLAVVDALIIALGVALFDRETILVRWK